MSAHRKTAQRNTTLAAVLLLIAAPSVVAFGEARSFYARNATNTSIISSGRKRDFIVYVPRTYDRMRRTPLVISLHGAGMWAAAQRETSQWNPVADAERFIVAYPSGDDRGGPRIWHVETSPLLQEDVRFIADMIDTLQATYNIDATRIYANGLSNGGGMSFVLSCTMHDRIAAVGLVASAQTLPFSWCPDKRPVPMIAFHGTADPVTPYHGGVAWVTPRAFPDFPGWVASWAQRNHCAQATDTRIASDVVRRIHSNCDADVEFYTIEGGGHSWPGGGPLPEWLVGSTSNSISASRVMWEFFKAHPHAR